MKISRVSNLLRSLLVFLAGLVGVESVAIYFDIPSAHADVAGKGTKDMSPAPNKEHGPCEGMG